MTKTKGFTLIELLIVIGILAILATTVVLVLNPAQILAESRDTQRISDLGSVQSAIGLLLATATTTVTFVTTPQCSGPTGGTCVAADHGFTAAGGALNTSRNVNGTGWVGVDLTKTSGGAPISTLPTDPQNTSTFHYAYVGDNTAKTYVLHARIESAKLAYSTMTNDGDVDNNCGTSAAVVYNADCWYSIGTDPSLDL
jgi:prepilin-type N-terminal cleavage/methylation domain-containing protein